MEAPSAPNVTAEEYLKYLDILQAIIARLAGNSFALRGWSVTLIAGLFALAAKDTNADLVVIAYLPGVAFWMLDAYYLSQERRYRVLFDRAAARDPHLPIFSLDVTLPHAGSSRMDWVRACLSGPILVFHSALLISVTIATAVLYVKGGH